MVNQLPWTFLDEYRGKVFTGTWPTIPQMFRITVLRYPDRPCFTEYAPDRISLSYSQAYEKIQTLAAYLRGLGLKKEEKIALTGKNSPEWAVAYLAILEAGAVVVPIDYQISMAETKNLLKASDATILFVDEEKAAELTTFCAGFKKVISLHESGKDYIYDLRLSEGSLPPEAQSILESDLAAILFTSGTTGTPKGVMLSHSNLVSDCYLAQANLHIYHTDVFYALLPIHHSYTMLAVFIEAISIGAEIVFGKKMVVKQILKDLKEAR